MRPKNNRCHDGHVNEARKCVRHEIGLIVNDVEFGGALEYVRAV
jgi:hypothetical protein